MSPRTHAGGEDPPPTQALEEPDGRYELAYTEGIRIIGQQHGDVDNLRSQATMLITAATVVASFLGGLGVLGKDAKPLPLWSVIALFAILILIGLVTFAILWPINWVFGLSPELLIDNYIEADPPKTLQEMRRDSAIWLQRHFDANQQKFAFRLWLFKIGAGLLLVEVIVLVVGLLRR